MNRSLTPIVCFAAASAFASHADAQAFLNGSLEGPTAAGTAPTDWFVWQNSPDTVDAAGPFNNTGTPWTISPDGGTFVRGIGNEFSTLSEAVAQVVTGFTSGDVYDVNFFQTNLGFLVATTASWNGSEGYWDLVVDGTVVDSSAIIAKPAVSGDPITWSFDTMTFTATAASHEIALVARSAFPGGPVSYMGIDGVRLSLVPTPGSAALFSLGGLALVRRRR